MSKRGKLTECAMVQGLVKMDLSGIAPAYYLNTSGALIGLEGEEEVVEAWLRKNMDELGLEL